MVTKSESHFPHIHRRLGSESLDPEERPGYDKTYETIAGLESGKRARTKGVTSFDFFELRDSSSDELLTFAASELGVTKEIILADGKTPESERFYAHVRRAFSHATHFVKKMVGEEKTPYYTFPSVDPTQIKDWRDLHSFIKTASLFQGSYQDMSRTCCGMLKWALTFYDLYGAEMFLAEKELDNIDGIFTEVYAQHEHAAQPFALVAPTDARLKGERRFTYRAGNKVHEGLVETRAKSIERAAIKMMSRPEATAQTALKDIFGYRFTLPYEQTPEFVAEIISWFSKAFSVDSFTIENQNFFSARDGKELMREVVTHPSISTQKGKKRSVAVTYEGKATANLNSGGTDGGPRFSACKIAFSVHIPKGGKGPEMIRRDFEIQIVTPDNENEKGVLKHDKYDVVGAVSAFARAYGSCELGFVERFARKYAQREDRAQEIVEELLSESTIVKGSVGSRRPVVFFRKHLERLAKAGIVSQHVVDAITRDRDALREHRKKPKQNVVAGYPNGMRSGNGLQKGKK